MKTTNVTNILGNIAARFADGGRSWRDGGDSVLGSTRASRVGLGALAQTIFHIALNRLSKHRAYNKERRDKKRKLATAGYRRRHARARALPNPKLVQRLASFHQGGAMFPLCAIALLMLRGHPLFGGVTLDGSFGTSGALPGPNYMISANLGKQVGANLFHSFNQFNLTSTQSATFTGPANVQNILSRVTGGTPSSIDGTVNSQIQGANLFFLNPAGVMFGQNAQINVSGSFAVSTANYLKLADGGKFNASLGGGDVLTSAPVRSFGFLNNGPAAVAFVGDNIDDGNGDVIGTPLNVAFGKTLSIVAGDISVNARTIGGVGSRVNLLSVRSAGEAQLDATDSAGAVDVTQFSRFGDINFTNLAGVDTSGPQGGGIVIRGANLHLDNSKIVSTTSGLFTGAAIDIVTTTSIKLENLGGIETSVGGGGGEDPGPGSAGAIGVQTTELRLETTFGFIFTNTDAGIGGGISINANSIFLSFSEIYSGCTGSGVAGDVTIFAGDVKLIMGGHIRTTTGEENAGANINLIANSLLIEGFGSGVRSQAFYSERNAGNIMISATNLKIADNGSISTSTTSLGNAGDITLHIGSALIEGDGPGDLNTGIFSKPVRGLGLGDAGDITMHVDHALTLTNGGFISVSNDAEFQGTTGDIVLDVAGPLEVATGAHISATTSSSENGGNLFITAKEIMLSGGGSAISANTFGDGNAGSVSVNATNLSLSDGGEISSSTESIGNGGNVKVIASNSLMIDGADSGIFADTKQMVFEQAFVSPLGKGDAGDVMVQAGKLTINAGGQISSSTQSLGDGGSVNLTADSLLIDGAGTRDTPTGVLALAAKGSSGIGGNVTINGGSLSLVNGGTVSAASFTSKAAGSVTLGSETPIGTLTLNSGSSISSANTGSGAAGDVSIYTAGPVKVRHGSSVSTLSSLADAGFIDLFSGESIRLSDHSTITASAGNNGGNIHIKAPDLVYITDSSITGTAGTKSSGTGGNITIDPQFIILRNSVISASATIGQGGNINLVSDFFFKTGSQLLVTGTTNSGTVSIAAPELDLGAELITLPSSLVSAANQLQERCTALLQGDFSSFITIGRGGTEPEPDELESAF